MKSVKRLYADFKPEHYELMLAPDREKMTFSGRVVIKARKTGRPSQRITLHQKDLKILSAKITRHDKRSGVTEIPVERINTQRSFDELRLHTKDQLFPGEFELELEFSGKITEPMHGIYPCNFKLDGVNKQLIATQFESHHAREAFPCIDEPEAKATFKLTIQSPAGESVISNTPISVQSENNGKLTTVFEKTPKMSTYLLAFVYGEIGYKESQTNSGVKVRVYGTPDKVPLTDFALNTTVKALEFFEKYYGVPYPLPKMDIIGLPDFSAGAMENWGLITFRESALYVDPKTTSIETKQIVAMVISHELAHQWFGNLVTMKWWNDLWLNESFAELMGYRAVDELFPEWKFWQVFVQREVSSALSRDSLPNVQSVQIEVNHPDEIGSVFDPSIVYAKGAALLNTVRHLVGEDSFREGLKKYFSEFKYGNTVADDLWKHLEDASHMHIRDMMEIWLQKPGYPVIMVDYEPGTDKFMATQQRLVIGEAPVGDIVWHVPLAASVKINTPMLRAKTAEFKLTEKSNTPLTLNHDGHSYFVSQYTNKKHIDAILKAVGDDSIGAIDRLLLVQNSLLLERAGLVSTLQNIQMLPAFGNELDETVWGMLAGIIGNARSLIDKDEALEDKLNLFVRPLAAKLVDHVGWEPGGNEAAQTHKLRSLAVSLAAATEDEQVVKKGQELFARFNDPADLYPDIRQAVYYIGVRYGDQADFDKLIKLHNSATNTDEQEEIAAELTSTRQTKQADQLLNLIKTNVRPQDFFHWFAWLIRNRYSREQTWQWLVKNWSWIEERFGSDKSYDYIPRYAASAFSRPKELKIFEDFFMTKRNIALERAINLGIEEIKGRIAWRQANEAAIIDWLKNLD